MNIASLQFLIFAAVAACAYNLLSSVMWRQWTLLALNIFFLYSFASDPKAYVPFLGFLLLGFVAVRASQRSQFRSIFYPLLLLVLLAFVWLKRYSFLPSSTLLRSTYVAVGLSYILFRVLHLMIDSHANTLGFSIGPISYLNYTLNFMTLVSGPIQRYEDFAATQLARPRKPLTIFAVGDGIHRIVVGFFKVTVVSWLLSMFQKQALEALTSSPFLNSRLLTGSFIVVLYPLYLYFNFSGYTDIVIGVGRFFRFALPENFNRPFASDNFISFWSRWHITLSNWLKTYIFNPLLIFFMRRISAPAVVPFLSVPALFVTFFVVGIWHGQTSEFVFFGFLQGFGVAVNQLYQVTMAKGLGQQKYRAVASNTLYIAFSRGLTFSWFAFTLLWFWSNWRQLKDLSQILGTGGALAVLLLIFLAATIVLSAMELLRNALLAITWNGSPVLLSRYVLTVFDTGLMAISLAVVVLLNAPAPDIVYKAF